jgi:predicted nuclease with TOPRIM domain
VSNPTTPREMIANLQRENAALKAKVEVIVKNYEDYKAENAALNETARKHVAAYYELLDENTALRADRDRLDWLMTQKHIRYPFAPHDDGKVLRERIDAAMKEAQP